jgi:hypothetical protein
MNITKVKFKGTETEVHYNEVEKISSENSVTTSVVKIKCSDQRAPEFTEASIKLLDQLMFMFKMDEVFESEENGFCKKKILSEVNIDSYNVKPFMDAIIEIKLYEYTTNLKIKTPKIIISDMSMVIYNFVQQAQNFVAGERAQLDMLKQQGSIENSVNDLFSESNNE